MGFLPSYANTFLSNTINANVFIGLLDSSGNELSGGGYKRHKLGEIDKSIEAQIANKEYIFMFEALADIGTARYFALFTGESSSTMIFKDELMGGGLAIRSGYVPLIRDHELIIALDKDVIESYD